MSERLKKALQTLMKPAPGKDAKRTSQRCTRRLRHPQCWEHGCEHFDGCEVGALIRQRLIKGTE